MISTAPFGTAPDGSAVTRFEISGGGIAVRIMDFGATIVGIDVPDAHGASADIVLGYPTVDGYAGANPSCYGATIGPSANRIGGARLTIDGTEWCLAANEGENNLHTDLDHGLHKRMWTAEVDEEANAVRMTCALAHGELGLPGERTFSAEFSVSPQGVFTLRYTCDSDRRTFANMTNHTYFNLAGHGAGSVRDQVVSVAASRFAVLDDHSVSTGELRDVAGTPLDFRTLKPLGRDIESDYAQIRIANGFDHCMVVDGFWPCGHLRPALHAEDPASGRTMDIRITAPGAHLYTGNFCDDVHAKDDATYTTNSGFAFEPEYIPNTPNIPSFPQCFCGPDHPFESVIEYRFGTI